MFRFGNFQSLISIWQSQILDLDVAISNPWFLWKCVKIGNPNRPKCATFRNKMNQKKFILTIITSKPWFLLKMSQNQEQNLVKMLRFCRSAHLFFWCICLGLTGLLAEKVGGKSLEKNRENHCKVIEIYGKSLRVLLIIAFPLKTNRWSSVFRWEFIPVNHRIVWVH